VVVLYYISELRRLSQKSPLPLIGYLSQTLTRSSHLDLAPIFLAVGLGIASYFFPLRAALAGALLACLCDAFAALIGMKFGKTRILFLKKTYLGTLAFFLSALLVLIPLLGWRGALTTAFAASAIEALSIEGVDNLLLPIFGGLIARYFL
jgi:dolichol kinase